MTERWRKRLGDLDKAAPSDDVLARAKEGPRVPEETIERPSRSARAVTAVAAFLIFALAISVFAIPALRLRSGAGGAPPGGLQPLWPFQTLDEVEEYERDPGPFGSMGSGAFLDPAETAWAFGYEVLGWGKGEFQVVEVATPEPASPSGSLPFVASDATATLTSAPTSVSARIRTFWFGPTCPPGTFCRPGGSQVTVFQPLGSTEHNAWAVAEATSDMAELAIHPGTVLRAGSVVSANAVLPPNTVPSLGVHVGAGDCEVTLSQRAHETIRWGPTSNDATPIGMSLSLDLPPKPAECDPVEPGHVFVSVAPEQGVGSDDPLVTRSAFPLVAIAAVPIVVEWSDQPRPSGSTGGPPTAIETREPVAWTTYTDQLGWTIDVPSSWTVEPFEESDARTMTSRTGARLFSGALDSGGGPSSGEVLFTVSHFGTPPIPTPADDSSFPLSADDLEDNEGGRQLSFRGDGLPFILDVRGGVDFELDTQQESIVRRMIASIHFEPWELGDVRNGWSVVDLSSDQDPAAEEAGLQWVWLPVAPDRGWTGVFVQGEDVVLGPMPTDCCARPRYTASNDPRGPFIDCPGELDQGWTVDGSPFPTNPVPFQHTVEVHPVITAWDGTLLTNRDYTL